MPIKWDLLQLILKEADIHFQQIGQPYLAVLFKAMLSTAYFGLFRIVEITASPHTIRACDNHVGLNKKKMMFILWTSKSHDKGSKPQIVKITAYKSNDGLTDVPKHRVPVQCPFQLLCSYIHCRPYWQGAHEQLFVFLDNSPVQSHHLCRCLSVIIKSLNLDAAAYSVHSLRSGRATDLYKAGLSVETIKKISRWRSNVIYTYLRD